MLFLTIVKSALKSLVANKLRSFLAMLGIIIGVGAVISMLAIVAGARRDMMSRITSMGTNRLMVRPGQEGQRGVMSGSSQKLSLDDASAILVQVPNVEAVSPSVNGNAQLKYYNKNSRTSVVGAAVTYPELSSTTVQHGRFFKETECERMARVVLLGPQTAEDLGVTKDDIGEPLKINGVRFTILGIFKAKGGEGFFNPDDRAVVPYTTAMNILYGKDSLDGIDVQAKDGANLKAVETSITEVLRKRHKITDPANDDFSVRNQADMVEFANQASKTFTLLLGGIAAISLLVGGIGIMNIMLVTVTERTREIGIRKAIGARDRDILQQFLIESMIMSIVGGLIGVATGFGISAIISHMSTTFKAVVEIKSVLISLSFAAGVGIFFGYYPAWRAAQLNPIECLYYE